MISLSEMQSEKQGIIDDVYLVQNLELNSQKFNFV